MSDPSFSFPPAANPLPNNFPITSPRFSAPNDFDLSFIRNGSQFVVKDINSNIIFKVKSFSSNRILVDANGNPIVTLRRKKLNAHDTWEVFRRENTNSNDLIFTIKRPSMLQWKKLDVFLANNKEERFCDYEVKGNWSTKSYAVYARGCSTLVAQMHKKTADESLLNRKNNFVLSVCPNVDYGFMVVFILILASINNKLVVKKKLLSLCFHSIGL